MRTTLASRVVRLTTAGATVIILVFGSVGYRVIRGNAKTEIIHRQQNAAAAAMSTVERMLADALDDIQLIAEDDTFLQQRLKVRKPEPNSVLARAQNEHLDEKVRLTGPWNRVLVVDRTGTILMSDGARQLGQSIPNDAAAREVFAAALAGRTTHSDVYLPQDGGSPALVFAAPIRSDGGDRSQTFGVALGWFALPTLNAFLDQVQPPTVARLVNAHGLTIAARTAAASEILHLRVDPLASPADVVRTSHLEERLGSARSSGWRMVFDIPSEVAYAPVRELGRWMGLWAADLLLCFISLGYFLARYFVRPIEKLTEAAARVSAGDLESHVVIRTGDEIERLGGAFNEMLTRLEKQIEERERSEQRFQMAARATRDVIFDWDLLTNACWVNEAWQSLFGKSTWGDLDVSDWSSALHPDERDQVFGSVQAAIDSGQQVWQSEYRFRRGDGSYAEVLTHAFIVRSEGGQPLRMVGAMADITERKRVEQDLRSSQAFLKSTIDSIPEIVAVKSSSDSRYVMVNSRALGLGLTILGKTDFEIFPPEQAELMRAEDLLVLETRAPSPAETREYHVGGKTASFKTSRVPLLDAHGDVEHILVVAEDVTERLLQDDLRLQKDAAVSANAAKSEFLARMSHEIRTPMNGVLGMSSLLADTNLTADQREYADTIHSSANALLVIINDILDLSRIDSGKMVLERLPFSLRRTMSESAKVLAVAAAQKSIELVVDIDPEVPDGLVGDGTRLRQMILNLAGNAVKFTNHGEIVLSAVMELPATDSLRLRVSVRDTGGGIPSDQIGRMFEPFEQLDSSGTRSHGGTGLGLAITRRLADLMGGTVWAESEPGVGSTFHFTANFEAQTSGAPGNRELEGRRVVLIEGNASARSAASRMLAAHGAEVSAFADCDGALAWCANSRRLPFDTLIVDSLLAEAGGGVMIERAVAHGIRPDQIVMLLSAARLQMGAQQTARFGVERYLVKPVVEERLIEILQQKAGVRTSAHSVPDQTAPVHPLRILVAEDNLVNQRVATRFLERDGHTAVLASNGREAVAAFQRTSFDVILMDVQMPEMDGLAATREIRKLEQSLGFHTPIIALTAHSVEGDRELCMSAGMDGYVSKPIKAAELRSAIAAVVPTTATKLAS